MAGATEIDTHRVQKRGRHLTSPGKAHGRKSSLIEDAKLCTTRLALPKGSQLAISITPAPHPHPEPGYRFKQDPPRVLWYTEGSNTTVCTHTSFVCSVPIQLTLTHPHPKPSYSICFPVSFPGLSTCTRSHLEKIKCMYLSLQMVYL